MDEEELNLYIEAGQMFDVVRKLNASILNHAMHIKLLEDLTVKLAVKVAKLEKRVEELGKEE